MRISDWSSDVCSSDLATALGLGRELRGAPGLRQAQPQEVGARRAVEVPAGEAFARDLAARFRLALAAFRHLPRDATADQLGGDLGGQRAGHPAGAVHGAADAAERALRSEEHTSELQSLMRISYA